MFDELNDMPTKLPENSQIDNQLILCLRVLSQINPSTQQLALCQNRMNNLMKIPQILSRMCSLLVNDDINFTKLVVTQIGIYLKKQKINYSSNRHDSYSIHQQLQLCFINKGISKQTKMLVSNYYSEFIYAQHNTRIKEDAIRQLTQYFSSLNVNGNTWGSLHLPHQQVIANFEFEKIQLYLHIIRALYNGPISTADIKKMSKQIYPFLLAFMRRQIHAVSSILLQYSIYQKDLFDKFQQLLSLIMLIFVKVDIEQVLILKEDMIKLPQTNQLFIDILSLKINQGNSLTTTLTAKQQNIQICKIIDKCKCTVMSMVYNMSRILLKKKYFTNETQNYIPLETSKKILIVIGSTLVQQYQQLNQIQLPNISQPLYKSALKTISMLIKIPPLYQQVLKLNHQLIYGLCFPLLIIKPQQQSMRAQDYKNKRQDIPNTQTLNLIQNTASKVVENYCDNIDGIVTQLVGVCINLIQFQLTANPNNFSVLPSQLLKTKFWNQFDHCEQICTALTVLTVISYMGNARQDIVLTIQQFIIKTYRFFCNFQHPASLHISFILLYTYYIDNFYQLVSKNSSQRRKIHLTLQHYLTELIQNHYDHNKRQYKNGQIGKTVVLQALDCLSNSLNQLNLFNVIYLQDTDSQLFLELINCILEQISTAHNLVAIQAIDQLFTEHIRNSLKNSMGLNNLPSLLRNHALPIIVFRLFCYYDNSLPNKNLVQIKIMQLIYILLYASNDIFQMFQKGKSILLRWNQSDCQTILTCAQLVLRKSLEVQLTQKNCDLLNNIGKFVVDYLPFIIRQNLLSCSFGILVNLSVLGIGVETILKTVLQVTVNLLEQVTCETSFILANNLSAEDLQLNIEKLITLIMINAYRNYRLVNNTIWIQFLQVTHNLCKIITEKAIGNRNIIGKMIVTSIAILCKIQIETIDPVICEHLYSRMLVCDKIYTTKYQKKILCLLLINKLHHNLQQSESQAAIYNLVSKLIYTLWNQAVYENQQDESSEEDFENNWRPKPYTLQENEFTLRLQNQVVALRDLSLKYAEFGSKWYQQVFEKLPPAIRSFIKGKVVMYQPIQGRQQQLRKIYKIKKIDSI